MAGVKLGVGAKLGVGVGRGVGAGLSMGIESSKGVVAGVEEEGGDMVIVLVKSAVKVVETSAGAVTRFEGGGVGSRGWLVDEAGSGGGSTSIGTGGRTDLSIFSTAEGVMDLRKSSTAASDGVDTRGVTGVEMRVSRGI